MTHKWTECSLEHNPEYSKDWTFLFITRNTLVEKSVVDLLVTGKAGLRTIRNSVPHIERWKGLSPCCCVGMFASGEHRMRGYLFWIARVWIYCDYLCTLTLNLEILNKALVFHLIVVSYLSVSLIFLTQYWLFNRDTGKKLLIFTASFNIKKEWQNQELDLPTNSVFKRKVMGKCSWNKIKWRLLPF